MRSLVWHGGDQLELEQQPRPEGDDSHVVLDIRLAGICGSDLHAYGGHGGPRRPPLVLGHEAVGTVDGRPGHFALFPLVYCGRCAACRRGEENLCEQRGLVGMDRPGVFADAVRVRDDALVAVPEGMEDRRAILVEPLATGFSALELEGVTSDQTVLVVGCGPIGLLTVFAAKVRGARVLAVEPVPARRRLAEAFGADVAVSDFDVLRAEPADVAIDAVGIPSTWGGAVRGVRSGGSVVILGLGSAGGDMPVGDLVRRGVTVRGHYAYRRRDFEEALALLAEHPIDLDWLTIVALEEGAEAFRRLASNLGAVTKVLIEMPA